jgi:transglutaminase-like putative cysteine protease
MRISVIHSTIYRYDQPVFQEPHTFRLRPRQDAAQNLLRYALEISPSPAGKTDCLDQDGNVVLEAWFDSPLEEMAVKSSFEIDTQRDNPFDFVLANPELAVLPLVYQPPLRSALAPYLGCGAGAPVCGSVPDFACHPLVQELARSVAERAGWATLGFLTELNRSLSENFQHTVRDEGPPLDPETTLRDGAGTCRDMAVLFCSACRAVGIPARFVSGYEREAALQDQANMHAWAEVYLAGGGWRGYDPSAGLAVSTSYVTVAAAADPRLAAPISGSYRGAATAKMEFSISMEIGGA